jgi:hypothetical protein
VLCEVDEKMLGSITKQKAKFQVDNKITSSNEILNEKNELNVFF